MLTAERRLKMDVNEARQLEEAKTRITADDDAAILISQRADDVAVTVVGAPLAVVRLKKWAYKWLGGVQ